MHNDQPKTIEFDAIRLKLASPDSILDWSHGEILKPETINYRTQKPEKDGLFCEKIFGPTKDWECYCGKYRKIRYKGIICDKCGVEVTRSLVRRERMGHIKLAAPVSHIWFLRGVPSKIGLILDLSVQELEKVIYFASFIITEVNDQLREETLKQIEAEHQVKKKSIEAEFSRRVSDIKQEHLQKTEKAKDDKAQKEITTSQEKELKANSAMREEKLKSLSDAVDLAKKELKGLQPMQIISEQMYQDLSLKYGHVFEASIGAEAIRYLLEKINPDTMAKKLEQEIEEAPENKRRRLVRRLKLTKSLKVNNISSEWMILNVIPVIPPDLRPMVQLDGGRFATSDLNDLYRRVINRNNRLKKLINLNAPEVISRNEKRMLQEAVDALIDNGARHGKTVTASTGQKRMLKSIADILKGKQGRFRQNLLGKRVDYSGRSVIVVGPSLKMDECGLPKRMALELFKPFIISKLIQREYVHNVRSAGKYIESQKPEVWDILEEITKKSHVMLNRAPTLHRLGIQSFRPVLIEGKAIQIHPLVCTAFNADFDGDQMAVHVPLTENAKEEASTIMLSSNNLLKPATGAPVATPSQDIVLGCYYLTLVIEEDKPKKIFGSTDEAMMAYQLRVIGIQDKIKVKIEKSIVETSIGRIVFNSVLPKELQFVNETMSKKTVSKIVAKAMLLFGNKETAKMLDKLKNLGFEYLTFSGISWGMADLRIPEGKYKVIGEAEKQIDEIRSHYDQGLLTDDERHVKVIEVWAAIKEEIQKLSKQEIGKYSPVYGMIESGARGSWGQITQMMGMKGLVTNPAGETIELPVKGSFKEGFDVLEYFISTHGARKGLSDTALRTANAGYLTRRLIDVCQDIVITDEDCKDDEGIEILKQECEDTNETMASRIIGRVVIDKVVNPKTKKVLVKPGELVTEEMGEKLEKIVLDDVKVRSVLSCRSIRGVCRKCYGFDLGFNKLVVSGTAVGIVAAQSIGEPGTQLTMRTFHTGGVAGHDITQGLPRVEEIFEARPIKIAAVLSDVDGKVEVIDEDKGAKLIKINYKSINKDKYFLGKGKKKEKVDLKVKDGAKVKVDDVLFVSGSNQVKARTSGTIKFKDDDKILIISELDSIKEFNIAAGQALWVKNGDLVNKGDQITDGSLDLYQLHSLKGRFAVQKYIIKEIQNIYSSQGQKLNDKHIEVIVRQMFSRAYVKDAGDTHFLPGEIVEKSQITEANTEIKNKGGKVAEFDQLLLGITKASLSIDSFLSAASFQETARVLIDAAVSGKVDRLRGLKENVIIGKLIPAGTGYRQK